MGKNETLISFNSNTVSIEDELEFIQIYDKTVISFE